MVIIYVLIILMLCTIALLGYLLYRRVPIVPGKNKISLLELAEFDSIKPEVRDFYTEVILETWMKALNASINTQFDKSGINQFYKDNKVQVLKLNDLYLQIVKLAIEKKQEFLGDFKLMMYNSNLDRLIQDAEAKLVEMKALNDPQVTRK